jgi:co-chaperonin GroES (HSP10)
MSTQIVDILSTEFQPKNEYVLVKPIELKKEEITASGLVISLNKNQRSFDRPTIGEVISLGTDIKDLTEGIVVIWPMTDGLDIEFIDGKFILLRYSSIIGSKK